ncbi:MAG: hypothetical protein ACRC9L_03460, partial [Brevinema sp.]
YFFNSSFRLSSFGGETDSNHMSGYAADIALSPEEKKQVLKYIKENMTDTNRIKQGLPTINQAISYPLANKPFIHVDIRPDGSARYDSNRRFMIDTNGTSVRYDFDSKSNQER